MSGRRYSDDDVIARLTAMGFEQGPTTKRLTRLHWPEVKGPVGSLYLLFSKAQKGVVIKVHPDLNVSHLPEGCDVQGEYFNHSLREFPIVVQEGKTERTHRGVSVYVHDDQALVALAQRIMKAEVLSPEPVDVHAARCACEACQSIGNPDPADEPQGESSPEPEPTCEHPAGCSCETCAPAPEPTSEPKVEHPQGCGCATCAPESTPEPKVEHPQGCGCTTCAPESTPEPKVEHPQGCGCATCAPEPKREPPAARRGFWGWLKGLFGG